ncbi:MAG: glyoxylate/hydroxypyruvate reductase A [Gammaproteobacteria bacterium]|nr:glyoxylate/hydroxypyruvate reductase A [Gammaproteobacteria bacterium]
MAILLNNNGFDNQPWSHALAKLLPDMPIYNYPDIPAAQEIDYAVVWNHPHGDLLNYPNLKAILMLGAGMDHIDAEPELPKVPIVRLVDPAVGDDMAQYALYWLIHFQRRFEDYRQQAEARHWQRYEVPLSRDFRVSVIGLGPIGSIIAERIGLCGFNARGWSRSGKQLENVECYSGSDGLTEIMASTDALVNCLPLNTGTRHFLDQNTLGLLPKGAFLLNVSRGAVIDDQALLCLLDSGHIAGAALDAFAEEPLPADSPFWSRDNVFVTPHVAGGTYPKTAARVIVDNIRRIEAGQQPFPVYERQPE